MDSKTNRLPDRQTNRRHVKLNLQHTRAKNTNEHPQRVHQKVYFHTTKRVKLTVIENIHCMTRSLTWGNCTQGMAGRDWLGPSFPQPLPPGPFQKLPFLPPRQTLWDLHFSKIRLSLKHKYLYWLPIVLLPTSSPPHFPSFSPPPLFSSPPLLCLPHLLLLPPPTDSVWATDRKV